jgi:hypothetical protein
MKPIKRVSNEYFGAYAGSCASWNLVCQWKQSSEAQEMYKEMAKAEAEQEVTIPKITGAQWGMLAGVSVVCLAALAFVSRK